MKRLGIVVGALCLLTHGAWAACPTTSLTFKDAGGATQTLCFGQQAAGFFLGQSEPISSSGAALDGTAGTAAAGVLSVQGIAGMTKLLVTPDSVALPANQSVNATQFGNTNISTGTGAGGAGIPRVTVSQDSAINNTACTSKIAVNQTASTDVFTSVNKLWICSIDLVVAGQEQVSIVEGTGTTCATGTAALWGATTADATHGMPFAANGGFAKTAASPFAVTATTADHLCILKSGANLLSGAIWYTDHS